jgi:hypothetical protein
LEILERYDFGKQLEALRKKWNIDVSKLEDLDDDKVLREWTVFIEDPDLNKDVEQMLKELEIPLVWMDLILSYVLRDKAEVYEEDGTYFTNESEGTVLTINTSSPADIKISLGKEFVLSDLDKVKSLLKKTGKFRTSRRQDNEYTNWKRDQKIFYMAKEGKNLAEIATAIDKEYGTDISYGTIKTVVSDWYKRTRTPESEQVKLVTK